MDKLGLVFGKGLQAVSLGNFLPCSSLTKHPGPPGEGCYGEQIGTIQTGEVSPSPSLYLQGQPSFRTTWVQRGSPPIARLGCHGQPASFAFLQKPAFPHLAGTHLPLRLPAGPTLPQPALPHCRWLRARVSSEQTAVEGASSPSLPPKSAQESRAFTRLAAALPGVLPAGSPLYSSPTMSGHPTNLRVKLPLLCALLQLATVLLFAFFVQYDSHTSPRLWHEEMQLHSKGPLDNEFYPRYPSEYLPHRRCPPARVPGPSWEHRRNKGPGKRPLFAKSVAWCPSCLG
ncbi:uncharacterized protein LOC131186843 [Ahaetulla prasina]|uniref:uncharacterized protein LOC131186843 n=1 Tax=Ahaetulla prasina TaxID=499056 RepID=UPI00264A120D|nr:uncharacterized protein LOC131186843 [Ahaetulla prasina]